MATEELSLDPARSALIIQDLQNDVIIEGGAFAESGAPAHATSQNVVENVSRLAGAARSAGMPVIHVWYIVEQGAPDSPKAPPSMMTSFCRSWMISAVRLGSSWTGVSFSLTAFLLLRRPSLADASQRMYGSRLPATLSSTR